MKRFKASTEMGRVTHVIPLPSGVWLVQFQQGYLLTITPAGEIKKLPAGNFYHPPEGVLFQHKGQDTEKRYISADGTTSTDSSSAVNTRECQPHKNYFGFGLSKKEAINKRTKKTRILLWLLLID